MLFIHLAEIGLMCLKEVFSAIRTDSNEPF
jgi:hypothetical protein